MLFRRTYGVAILVGLILGGLVTIQVVSILDVPGTEIVHRERGTGTRCAEGSRNACFDLCVSLSDVSTIRCVQQLTQVFPIEEGGGPSAGVPPSSPTGGRPQGPAPTPSKPGPPTPGPEPPTIPGICTHRPLPPVCLDLP